MKGRRSGKAAEARSVAGTSEMSGGGVEDPRLVKQVRELRRLVPSRREPCCEFGELFEDAASHIEDLQVQVKLMRMLLEKLSED
ncbi:hypothetical protein GUJ93_ZPchr0003g16943 [Zizania palustris]|uniref:BHLH domain-containing protein n=1 Tax=Zizania palustris TaxID=103762 RepID=A0A8J5SD18_ZIZPA|nr:hypothetical protein GUJ93_ZPchr0003g16943 [Zizania palustris]